MRRVIKPKTQKARKVPAQLRKAYEELDKTARTLIQTDLKLREANERFHLQINQLHALHKLSTAINATFDIEEILKIVSESMLRELDFEKAGIVFLDPKGQKPMQSAYAGFSSHEYAHMLEQFESLIRPVLAQADDVFLQTQSFPSEPWSRVLHSVSLSSLLVLPLRFKAQTIGFIIAGRAHVTMRLSEPDRRFFGMYATQAASAIENARLYEVLGQSNLTLEEKIHDRTRSLIEANERLRELDTAKSNFISLVSHELRTPLTSIKGFATMLTKHDKEISDEKRKIYFHVLNEETDRLTRLITELLDISRIESGRMEFRWEALSLPAQLDKVFEKLSAQAKGVHFVKEFPDGFPDIVVDADKVEQILLNLLVNALRFSPPAGTVIVKGRQDRDGIVFEVIDQGCGIPFNEQEKIFDKFYRLDNDVNRKNPGTGLGLSICRALVNLHGGKVWAESEPGQGSRFYVTLPLNFDKLPSIPEQRFAAGGQ